jgi:hypothetical protein
MRREGKSVSSELLTIFLKCVYKHAVIRAIWVCGVFFLLAPSEMETGTMHCMPELAALVQRLQEVFAYLATKIAICLNEPFIHKTFLAF